MSDGSAAVIDVVVNGEPSRLEAGLTLTTWLQSVGRDARTVAIELNGEIAPRATFDGTPIRDGDRLEVVGFVQGG
ncbi:MAG: sulfur carrier protein ThiS [Acidobacteriota bacterium]